MRTLAALLVLMTLAGPSLAGDPRDDLIAVPAGQLRQGDPAGAADEVVRTVSLASFAIMRHEVTNDQFAVFVAASGHVTDPERKGWGWVWPGTWRQVQGVDWRRPHGLDTSIADRGDHPVVQISQRDAAAFCAWYDLRLPRDAEWEYAARGRDDRTFPWGDSLPEAGDGSRLANFGTLACCASNDSDGYRTTAPVGSYPQGASPFGLLDMAGNVWEWTASPYPPDAAEVTLRGGGWGNNPFCLRVSYRHGNPPGIGLDMVGFRCAGDLE